MDDILHSFCSRWQDPNGNVYVPYLNLENRKFNLYNLDNQWNDNDWFVVRRKYLHFSESFNLTCLAQPPIILPISSSRTEMAVYFLLSNALISQAILRKNFKRSSSAEASSTADNFCVSLRWQALKVNLMVSKNASSILLPSEYRDVLGKFGRNSCHNL